MSAPMKHKLCRILRRCNLNFMLVFLFVASSISVFITCLYINVIFGDFNDESKNSLLHFEDQKEDLLLNIEDEDDDEGIIYRNVNLITDKIIDKRTIEIIGWWMLSPSSWTTEIDCNTETNSICSKILTVQCKHDSMRAVYQYLPLKKGSTIKSLYFSAKSLANQMEEDPEFVQLSMYSAIALLKFMDGTTQRLRLDFPSGSHSYLLSEIETTFINENSLTSIMVVLSCYGYNGNAKFVDVTVTLNKEDDHEASDLISRCPKNLIQGYNEEYEQEVIVLSKQNRGTISLVTQLSMDDIQLLVTLSQHWHDELSVALYVPTKSETKDSNHEWQRLYINKKIKPLKTKSVFSLSAVFANMVSGQYPVNHLTNIAIRQSISEFIFVLDADFLPSMNFKDNFLKWIDPEKFNGNLDKTAFVVPVFEFLSSKEAIHPASKEDLVKDIFDPKGLISPYQYSDNPEAHRATNYQVWYRSNEPYKVTGYQDQYEPYLILRRSTSLPEHNEHFSGRDFSRATFTMELKAAGYEFIVLPDVWAIHMPHRKSSHETPLLEDPSQLQSHLRRFEFVSKLLTQYGIGRCGRRSLVNV